MEGTEAQVIFKLPSVRGFVAQHSTHLTDEQLRRLTAPAVTEVSDIVHEVSVNVDELEYIAPPYCISEHDGASSQVSNTPQTSNSRACSFSTDTRKHSPHTAMREALSTTIATSDWVCELCMNDDCVDNKRHEGDGKAMNNRENE